MKNVIVVAPHPDDETLGCGGALLRHRTMGHRIHWLILSSMAGHPRYTAADRARRDKEIDAAARLYGFRSVHRAAFPTTRLDTVPIGELVAFVGGVFRKTKPETVYLPFEGDIHSDHGVAFRASVASTKWFRHPTIRRVLSYEALSETEFSAGLGRGGFQPNVFVDITPFLSRKIRIMKTFSSELGRFPFPRSVESIRALAAYRGTAAGCKAAEAFALVKEII